VGRRALVAVWLAASGHWGALAAPPVVTVSRTSPIVLSWPTNFPSFALQSKTNLGASVPWEDWAAKPAVIGANYVLTNGFADPRRLFRLSNWPQLACRDNLQSIGISLKVWALDNRDEFPFQVHTNAGGTLELRAPRPDGFDTNAFLHFRVLSNYLRTVTRLVCPGDIAREAASGFATLRPENVSYLLRTDDTVTQANPGEVLAVCPIDGNTLYCDGSVTNGLKY
jgi:hypothetical protein